MWELVLVWAWLLPSVQNILSTACYKKTRTLQYAQTCSSADRASSGLLSMQEGQMELRVAQRTGRGVLDWVSQRES
jgi:hypothetical protein